MRSSRKVFFLLPIGFFIVATAASAPAAVARSMGASISTDRDQYQIGDSVRVCYTMPAPGPMAITDIQADGSSHVLLSAYDDGTGWCFGATITPPSGTECLRLDYSTDAGAGSTQSCFQVGGGTPTAACPVAVTLANDGQNLALPLGQCLLLNLDSGYYWTVRVADSTLLTCIAASLAPDEQGTCSALSIGTTEVTATGDLPCRQSRPACMVPTRLFRLIVTVQSN